MNSPGNRAPSSSNGDTTKPLGASSVVSATTIVPSTGSSSSDNKPTVYVDISGNILPEAMPGSIATTASTAESIQSETQAVVYKYDTIQNEISSSEAVLHNPNASGELKEGAKMVLAVAKREGRKLMVKVWGGLMNLKKQVIPVRNNVKQAIALSVRTKYLGTGDIEVENTTMPRIQELDRDDLKASKTGGISSAGGAVNDRPRQDRRQDNIAEYSSAPSGRQDAGPGLDYEGQIAFYKRKADIAQVRLAQAQTDNDRMKMQLAFVAMHRRFLDATRQSREIGRASSGDNNKPTSVQNNQSAIDALMAQAYGNADIQDNLNILAKGTYTSKTTKKLGGKYLEVSFSYPNVMTVLRMKKLIKRVMHLGEQALVDPTGAYERLTSMRGFNEGGKAEASLQRLIKSRLRKNGYTSMPMAKEQYMELRKVFFENTLKGLDINMGGNREVVVAVLGIADTIFTQHNGMMQRAFSEANDFAKPTATTPQTQSAT